MEEPSDWSKLPIIDKIQHKNWKARLEGYTQLEKAASKLDPDSGFNEYAEALKRTPLDINIPAHEKGLQTILKCITLSTSFCKKISRELLGNMVAKSLNQKARTKQLALTLCLQIIENDQAETVLEALQSGLSAKQPKVIAGCVEIFTQALRDFGPRAINFKPFVCESIKLLDHSDKSIRDLVSAELVQLYIFIKDAAKVFLTNVKPIKLKELDEAFAKVAQEKPNITRAIGGAPVEAPENGHEDPDADEGGDRSRPVEFDPYELAASVDVLSTIGPEIYGSIAEKKWQLRKEAYETLEKRLNTPKLAEGDYQPLVSALKNTISTDTNIIVVAVAVKCVHHLVNGLRHSFSSHAHTLLPLILAKLTEKRASFLECARATIDSMLLCVDADSVFNCTRPFFQHKSPSVKEEVTKYTGRILLRANALKLGKPLVKSLIAELSKMLEESQVAIREVAFKALADAMVMFGEKNMMLLLDDLDTIKKTRLKEVYEKTKEASQPDPGAQKAAPNKGEQKRETPKEAHYKPEIKKVETVATTPRQAKKSPVKESKSAMDFEADQMEPSNDCDVPEGVMLQKLVELTSQELVDQMSSKVWKERLAAHEGFTDTVTSLEVDSEFNAGYVFKALAIGPGWKDSNFQVVKAKINIISLIVKKFCPFPRRIVFEIIPNLTERFADPKLKEKVYSTLFDLAECTSVNFVAVRVLNSYGNSKNIKNHIETFLFLAQTVSDFGMLIDIKFQLPFLKKGFESPNPELKKAITNYLCVLYLHLGPKLRMLLDDIKPATLQNIDAEFAKIKGEKPKPPIRGIKSASGVAGQEKPDECEDQPVENDMHETDVVDFEDLITRIDISPQITEELAEGIGNKNWKVRKESLVQVEQIISQAKHITPQIGQLDTLLIGRMTDPNKNLVIASLNICKALVEAMGRPITEYRQKFVPAVFNTLTDGKVQLRSAGIAVLSAIVKLIGLTPLLEGDPSLITAGIMINHSTSKCEILTWLASVLPEAKKLPKNLLAPVLKAVLSCVSDRKPETRKAVGPVVAALVPHLGAVAVQNEVNSLDAVSQGLLKTNVDEAVAALKSKEQPVRPSINLTDTKKPTKTSAKGSSSTNKYDVVGQIAEEATKTTLKPTEVKESRRRSGVKPKATELSEVIVEPKQEQPLVVYKPNSQKVRLKDNIVSRTPHSKEYFSYLQSHFNQYFAHDIVVDLFSSEFKKNISGIQTLVSLLADGSHNTQCQALLECSDLIVGYCGYKIGDCNPSVLSNCLELVEKLLTVMTQQGRKLLQEEAESILPSLVVKVADNKETTRKASRAVLFTIAKIYSVSSVIGHVLGVCDSKAQKTRQFSLNTLIEVVQQENVSIPALSNCSKLCAEMAKTLSDRSSSVRTAGLTFFTILYNQVGDEVYDYIDKLSNKEMSLLQNKFQNLPKPSERTFNLSTVSTTSNDSTINDSNLQTSATQIGEPSVLQKETLFDLNQFLASINVSTESEPLEATPVPPGLDEDLAYRDAMLVVASAEGDIEIPLFATFVDRLTSERVSTEYLEEVFAKMPLHIDNVVLGQTTIQHMMKGVVLLLRFMVANMQEVARPREFLLLSMRIISFIHYNSSFVHSVDAVNYVEIIRACVELIDESRWEMLPTISYGFVNAVLRFYLAFTFRTIPVNIVLQALSLMAVDGVIMDSDTKIQLVQLAVAVIEQRVGRSPVPTYFCCGPVLDVFNEHKLLPDSDEPPGSIKHILNDIFPPLMTYICKHADSCVTNNLASTHPYLLKRLTDTLPAALGMIASPRLPLNPITEVFDSMMDRARDPLLRNKICADLCTWEIEHSIRFSQRPKFVTLPIHLRVFLRLSYSLIRNHRVDAIALQFDQMCKRSPEKSPIDYKERAKRIVDRFNEVAGRSTPAHSANAAVPSKEVDSLAVPAVVKSLIDSVSSNSKKDTTLTETLDRPKLAPSNIEDLRRRLALVKQGFKK